MIGLNLNHDNVIKFLGVSQDSKEDGETSPDSKKKTVTYSLVMDWQEKGDVVKYLSDEAQKGISAARLNKLVSIQLVMEREPLIMTYIYRFRIAQKGSSICTRKMSCMAICTEGMFLLAVTALLA